MTISGIKGYNILLILDANPPMDDIDEKKYKGVNVILKFLNKIEYKKLILSQ